MIGFARTTLHGGTFSTARLPTFADEVARFHDTLAALHADLGYALTVASMSATSVSSRARSAMR